MIRMRPLLRQKYGPVPHPWWWTPMHLVTSPKGQTPGQTRPRPCPIDGKWRCPAKPSKLLDWYRAVAERLSPSTMKVYVVALGVYCATQGGHSAGSDPLVTRFLCGTRRLKPARQLRFPTWDLVVILEALCAPPFKQLEEVSEKNSDPEDCFSPGVVLTQN